MEISEDTKKEVPVKVISGMSFDLLEAAKGPSGGNVDGNPRRLYEADYYLRGVYVPPGDHTVEFVFNPLLQARRCCQRRHAADGRALPGCGVAEE